MHKKTRLRHLRALQPCCEGVCYDQGLPPRQMLCCILVNTMFLQWSTSRAGPLPCLPLCPHGRAGQPPRSPPDCRGRSVRPGQVRWGGCSRPDASHSLPSPTAYSAHSVLKSRYCDQYELRSKKNNHRFSA